MSLVLVSSCSFCYEKAHHFPSCTVFTAALYLEQNNIIGSIPTEIDGMASLGEFGLHRCWLSFPCVRSQYSLRSTLRSTGYLFLSDNHIVGPLPSELGVIPLST